MLNFTNPTFLLHQSCVIKAGSTSGAPLCGTTVFQFHQSHVFSAAILFSTAEQTALQASPSGNVGLFFPMFECVNYA